MKHRATKRRVFRRNSRNIKTLKGGSGEKYFQNVSQECIDCLPTLEPIFQSKINEIKDDFETKILELNKTIGDLTADNNEKKKEIIHFKDMNKETEKNALEYVQGLEKSMAILKTTNIKNEESNRETKMKLNIRIEELTSEKKVLEVENEGLLTQNTKQTTEQDKLRKKVLELEQKLHDQKETIVEIKNSNKVLQKSRKESPGMNLEFNKLKKINQDLTLENTKLKTDIQTLEEESVGQNERISNLESKVTEKEIALSELAVKLNDSETIKQLTFEEEEKLNAQLIKLEETRFLTLTKTKELETAQQEKEKAQIELDAALADKTQKENDLRAAEKEKKEALNKLVETTTAMEKVRVELQTAADLRGTAQKDLEIEKANAQKAKEDLITEKASTKKAQEDLITEKANTQKAKEDLETAKNAKIKIAKDLETAKEYLETAKEDLEKAKVEKIKIAKDLETARLNAVENASTSTLLGTLAYNTGQGALSTARNLTSIFKKGGARKRSSIRQMRQRATRQRATRHHSNRRKRSQTKRRR